MTTGLHARKKVSDVVAVQPQTGKRPTSSLKGAANILIQDVRPGRTTTHTGTAVDAPRVPREPKVRRAFRKRR